MLDNRTHNEHDVFAEIFRQKLESHRLFVNGDDWYVIEHRLKKKRKVHILWVCGTTIAAAVVTLLIIVVSPVWSEPFSIAITDEHVNIEDGQYSDAINLAETTINAREVSGKQLHHDVTSIPENKKKEEPYFTAESVSQQELPNGGGEEAYLSENADIQHSLPDLENEALPEDNSIVSVSENIEKSNGLFLYEEEGEPAKMKTNKWLLAAAFGSGGSSGTLNDNNMSFSDIMNSDNGLSTGGIDTDYSSITHGMPLSFGLMLRKNLGKHLGVETGLVYTYLSSRFEWSQSNARQNLHYLGIPVNLVTYLWNSNPNWSIYLSAGGMVEKGLKAKYTAHSDWSNGRSHTKIISTSMDALQWSLNGALGLNYRFDKGLGIYLEPRLSYYFDSEQPISMRTEWPLSIGINVGLNYEF